MNEEVVEQEESIKAKKRRKSYLKLNIMSLFFTAVSFISVTLAWFAYSGLVTTQTEVNVKAWYIEFNNKGKAVSNNIVISLNDIYPGMDLLSETIDIKNSGDSAANIEYKIKSVRILDDEYVLTDQNAIEDKLAHYYPFHINMSLSDTYADAKEGTGKFVVSVSWPLDSDSDDFDTEWGNKAYDFQDAEAKKVAADSSYQAKSSIELVISLEATQYIGEGNAPEPDYKLGSTILYDVVNNQKCEEVGGTCLKTYVIDKNNTLLDGSVKLIPDLYNLGGSAVAYSGYTDAYSAITSGWTVTHRSLKVSDMLPVISNDIESSVMVSDQISNQLVGYLGTDTRVESKINDVLKYNGYFRFKNEKFTYLSSTNCYWLGDKYSDTKQFALVKADDLFSKIYGQDLLNESGTPNTCKVVPVIEVSKIKLRESSN